MECGNLLPLSFRRGAAFFVGPFCRELAVWAFESPQNLISPRRFATQQSIWARRTYGRRLAQVGSSVPNGPRLARPGAGSNCQRSARRRNVIHHIIPPPISCLLPAPCSALPASVAPYIHQYNTLALSALFASAFVVPVSAGLLCVGREQAQRSSGTALPFAVPVLRETRSKSCPRTDLPESFSTLFHLFLARSGSRLKAVKARPPNAVRAGLLVDQHVALSVQFTFPKEQRTTLLFRLSLLIA